MAMVGGTNVVVEMGHVFRVGFVFEGGQARAVIRRIGATQPFGAFVAERVDVLSAGKRIKSGGGTPCECDSPVVFGRVRPPARGHVLEGGVSESECGVLIGHVRDRATICLQADIWETSPRWFAAAPQQ